MDVHKTISSRYDDSIVCLALVKLQHVPHDNFTSDGIVCSTDNPLLLLLH